MGKNKPEKKGKKNEPPPGPEMIEELVATTELEPEPEEIQYTDTSYTSASFEVLPAIPLEEPKAKKKKGKKKAESEIQVRKDASEFQWSEESLAADDEQVKAEEVVEVREPTKKKKGKKEKEKEEIPQFEKPNNWKKMNRKEREAWMAQRIEEWRAEKEAEKQAILAGAKEKRAALARERAELMASDQIEQDVRRDLLQKTCDLFHKFEHQKFEYLNKKQMEAEWQQYLLCDGLPDPRVTTQMNTYIHLWKLDPSCDDDALQKRCVEVLPMLEKLEEFVANPRQYTPLQAQSYNEVRLALREELKNAIQFASYTLLRDLEKRLKVQTIRLATYEREFKGLKLNMWVALRIPIRKPKPLDPDPEPIELSFPMIHVSLKLPKTIDKSCLGVRAARYMLDLLSESSRSFALTSEMPNRYEDLFIFNVKEFTETYKRKKEQDEIRDKFYKEINQKIREVENFLKANQYTKNEKEKEELDNLKMAEPPPLPDPRTFIAESNEAAFAKYLKSCMTRTRAGEINLRKYRICGGVLYLDLLTTPPQPKRLRGDLFLTTLQLPKSLQPLKYQVQYRAPSPPPPGVTRTPEEIEAEMKKVEAEYEKLALVMIDLPQDVMWSEPPVVCQWQEAKKLWTSNYVNDYKFNEDKLTLQFRTGVLWPIGIATLRYSNLPYQGWDIKPDPDGKGVIITVTGVCVTVTWVCVGNFVKLKWIANATTSALKEHFNKPYSVKRMLQIMREASCDFFPDFDAYNHVEGACPKEWICERHNYHAMAFLSRSHNFQWSRWNAAAGSRTIVMQMREAIDKKREELATAANPSNNIDWASCHFNFKGHFKGDKGHGYFKEAFDTFTHWQDHSLGICYLASIYCEVETKFQLLQVTPQRATILKCNELAQEYDATPMKGLGFYPDLFTLNISYGSMDARRTTFQMKYRLVETVFDMLQELKLSSFS